MYSGRLHKPAKTRMAKGSPTRRYRQPRLRAAFSGGFQFSIAPSEVSELHRWAINTMRSLGLISAMLVLPATLVADDGVILLHGINRSPASMRKIEAALVGAGYTVENVGYDAGARSIQELSDEVIGAALESARLGECLKVHFVTHSMGGILVRSYFKRHPTDRLGRVVMIAPPNRGSEVVDRIGDWYLFRKILGRAGGELGTHAQSTPIQLGPVEFECGVIAGDRTINWINSSMIPGPDDGKVSVERSQVDGMKDHMVVHATHPYIMNKTEVIKLTLRFLDEGTFGRKAAQPGATDNPDGAQ